MEIAFIRHGKTQGNVERRYIGTTDEPLCSIGEEQLRELAAFGAYPEAELAYVSPMRRCRETRALAFPKARELVVEELREQAFGVFENRSYEELQFLPAYRKWVEAACGGDAPAGEPGKALGLRLPENPESGESCAGEIPGGEASGAFRARCRAAFASCVEDGFRRGARRIAIVAHGGVLMAALSEYGRPGRAFYGWQAANAGGFLLRAEPERWAEEHTVEVLSVLGEEEKK